MTFVYFPPSSQHPSPEPCVKSRGSYWLSQASFPVTLIFGQQLTMCSSWSFPLFPTRARLSRCNLHHTFRLFIESQFGLPTLRRMMVELFPLARVEPNGDQSGGWRVSQTIQDEGPSEPKG